MAVSIVTAVTGVAILAGPASEAGASSACVVSAKQVNAVLGVHVGRPSMQHLGPVVSCTYPAKGNPRAVDVDVEKGATAKVWATTLENAAAKPLTTVKGLGRAASYGSWAGGVFLYVWNGKAALIISSSAPLPKVEALAKKALRKI
jgi:hypothetical protein